MKLLMPSDLLALAHRGFLPSGPVAVDTETSGLYPDSGARVSTVSIAFLDTEDYAWLNEVFPGEQSDDFEQVQTPAGIQTWDIEVIDQWTREPVMSFAWPYDQGVAGTGKVEDNGQTVLWPDTENLPPEEWAALIEWLHIVGKLHGLVMHHAKFDVQMFRSGVRRWPELVTELWQWVIWDTQNVADILSSRFVIVFVKGEPRPSTSLKPTAEYYWGKHSSDEQKVIREYLAKHKLPAGRWDLMPWDVIGKYADQDARLTIRLFERQNLDLATAGADKWLDGEGGRMTVKEAVERRLATSGMLYRVERRGLPFSVSAAGAASDDIRERVKSLERQLPFKPATLPTAKHYFFGEGTKKGVTGLGRKPYALTETGQPQMDVAIIQKMVLDGLPGAETWRDIQKLQTADEKWYTGWADRAGNDDRLRMSVRQNGTVSGRFSAEGLQLQAIPHDYKLQNFEILDGIPSPRTLIDAGVPSGWKLWELDLANAELRVAAMMAGCVRMLELIDQGADLHADAARELFDIDSDDPKWGEMRQVAKRFNFSAIFGVGKVKLQADIEQQTGIRFSIAEVEALLRAWHNLYPEYKKAIYATMDVIERRAKQNKGYGWVTMANGERRWFLPGEDWHKGFNQRVQGSLAQFGIDWWLGVESWLIDQFGDEHIAGVGRVGMVLMVHDSMVLLLPDDARGVEAVEYAVEAGVSLWRSRFPSVPGGVDSSLWASHS